MQQRSVIYVKDLMAITGRSERYSRDLYKRIRAHFNKEAHQFLSVQEFCSYAGLDVEIISKQIR